MAISVVSIQVSSHSQLLGGMADIQVKWYLFGYSLVFTPTSGSYFIGNLHNAVFRNTTGQTAFARVDATNLPAMVFGLFQGMFAAFT